MKNAVIYTATFAFLLSELIGLLSGLSVEQVLLRSVILYAIIFTLGKILVSVLEKVPAEEEKAAPGTDATPTVAGSTDQTLQAEMPGQPAAAPEQDMQDIGEQVGAAIKKAVLDKPKIVAETISAVIKNE